MRRRNWVALIVLSSLLVVAVSITLIYSRTAFYPATLSLQELATRYDTVSIRVEPGEISFLPKHTQKTGLVLYPGGNVDFRAYADLAAEIAKAGHPVFLVSMPLNLAILNPNRAESVVREHAQISSWVVGGHSLGGVMAVRYALKAQHNVQGVVLYASYPDRDISGTDLQVLSLFGSEDGLIDSARYEESRAYLPPNSSLIAIIGGNHCYFGHYGFQKGDNPAAITREAQQAFAVSETIRFLQAMGD